MHFILKMKLVLTQLLKDLMKYKKMKCPICYRTSKTRGIAFMTLSCKHVICESCVIACLKSRYRRCCLCRNPIRVFLREGNFSKYVY